MTDYNAGSYITGSYTTNVVNADTGYIYYDSPYYPLGQESSPVTVITNIVGVPVPEPQNNRKENDMIKRQTFLDALGDEGKPVDSEGWGIVKEAKAEKWELFIARLLARAFESADLAMLKEKPKQVEVLTKEA